MTQLIDNNWMEKEDELTFCPDCTERQITSEEREKYGCCAHCASCTPMPLINELISNVHVLFLDAPSDADAVADIRNIDTIWYKEITPVSCKYLLESERNTGKTDWTLTMQPPAHEPLVYRPADVVESPEEREYFEKLEREQQIDAMAAVIRTCPTNSATGIAHLLVEAGCTIDTARIRK